MKILSRRLELVIVSVVATLGRLKSIAVVQTEFVDSLAVAKPL